MFAIRQVALHALVILFLIAIFIGVTFGGMFLGAYIFSLRISGVFAMWQSTNNLPLKATGILGTYGNTLYIKTSDDVIFEYWGSNSLCVSEPKASCWVKVEIPEKIVVDQTPYRSCWKQFTVSQPPANVTARLDTKDCSSGGVWQRNYVLLSDGSIWMWQHEVSDLQGIEVFFGLVVGLIIGLILGSAITVFLVHKWLKFKGAI